MISLLFTDVFITSIRTKNCNCTQWITRRSTTARSDCRVWMTSGSNLGTIAIRNASHSSTLTWSAFYGKPDREDASSYLYQQHEVFSIGYYVRCMYDALSLPSR